MQENSKGLEALCVESARVGSTCYGDVYRANLTVGDENGTYDITRISLPFTEEKRHEIQAHYPGCTEDELDRFCADFTKRVRVSVEASQKLQERGSRFVLPNQAVQGERSEDGRAYNMYIVSKPFLPLSQTIKIEPGETARLSNVLLALEHLCRIALDLDGAGLHAGAFDIDEMRCVLDNGKGLVYIGNMLFCSGEQDYSVPPVFLPHTAPAVRNGETPSLLTDIYSAFSIGWAILSGQYYRDLPDYTLIPDVGPELIDLMRNAMDYNAIKASGEKPEDAVKEIVKKLHAMTKNMKAKGASENTTFVITRRETALNFPDWLSSESTAEEKNDAPENALDAAEASENDGDEEARRAEKKPQKTAKKHSGEKTSEDSDGKSSKKKIFFVALAAALLLFVIFGGKLISGLAGGSKVNDPTEPTEPVGPADPTDNVRILIESIVTDVTEVKLQPGDSVEIHATIQPENAENKTLAWSSGDPEVCEATDGVITAVNPGYCTVYVHAADGSAEAQIFVEVEQPLVPLEKLEFLAESLELTEGDVRAIELQVIPDNADGVNLTWSSNNEDVAKVSYGTVTALSAGDAEIAVTDTETGISAVIKLSVVSADPDAETVHVTGVSLDRAEVTLTPGESVQLTATVEPEDADLDTVVWLTSNSRVATVVNGEITAASTGIAVITVKTVDGGFEAECTVNVRAPEPDTQPTPRPEPQPTPQPPSPQEPVTVKATGVKLNSSTLALTVGEKSTLKAEITPANATNTGVRWTSSNPKAATVENGTVSAVGAGTSVITVTTVDGSYTATCSVTVSETTVSVTSVTLSSNSLTLAVGSSAQLVPNVAPSDATNKDVTWITSNAGVASVTANGEVKAVSAGTATITVTTADGGYKATCVVTVIDESQMPGGTGEEGSGDGEGHEMDGSNEDVSGTDYGGGESTIVQPNP